MNRKTRILGIAPYETLANTLIRVANERDDIELTVEVGNIQGGAEIALQYEDQDFDAILSRGGTKTEIERVTSKPVFEIPISYFDLLNVVKLVEHYQGKVALMAYENIANSARVLCDIFHYDYNISVISENTSAEEMVRHLKEEGYTLIIGDTVATICAEKLGLQSMLLISGEESAREAFDNVVNVCKYYSDIKHENSIFHAYIRSQEDKIIVLDESGEIHFSTLAKDRKSLVNFCRGMISSIQTGEPVIAHKKISENFLTISGNKGRMDKKTFYFFNIHKYRKSYSYSSTLKSVTAYNSDDFLGQSKMGLFFFQSFHADLWKAVNSTASFDTPVLMIGEAGSEKERLVFQIYLKSKKKYDPLYVVNCSLLTEKELHYMMNAENSPLYALHGSVFFKGIEKMSQDLFEMLLDGLQNMFWGLRSRLIFTYETIPGQDQEKETARCNAIKTHIGCYEIRIPPLRETPEAIPNFAVLYIHQRNHQSGSQIVGIEPEGISLLQEYKWPQNVNQLQRLLDEAILTTESPWITTKSIRQLLMAEKQSAIISSGQGTQINIKQSLSGIIYDAVMAVLAEENMNQVKTAKRLGISRTTLWRLLRQDKNQ